MWKTLITLSLLSLLALAVAQGAKPTQAPSTKGATTPYYTVPVEAARKENPVSATPESLARGKKQYGYDCAMCHGKEGNGKGDVAVDMKLGMHDDAASRTRARSPRSLRKRRRRTDQWPTVVLTQNFVLRLHEPAGIALRPQMAEFDIAREHAE